MDSTAYENDLVPIARAGTAGKAHELGLVVLSMGEPYWIDEVEAEGDWLLLVEPQYADFLEEQVRLYENESANWPPVSPEIPEPHPGSYAAMTWIAGLILAFLCQMRWPVLEQWGMVSSQAIRAGELYRPFTALFLHDNIGHLTGNLIFGAVFLHLVARHIGTLRAWAFVLLAGTAGNFLNAFLHFETSHYSIGASTAVFGTIGILVMLPVGFAIRHARQRLKHLWLLPLLAGFAFLAWFGTGGERTDTTAHLTGFLCGLPLGLFGGLRVSPGGAETSGPDGP